ncbi:phosphotransferase [Lentzea sp. NPDC058450]|uniref:phosphotransferase n=1 Tax=Lentzea sp. NPDC058450 TaxID=3346505 RepID=UPI00364E1337
MNETPLPGGCTNEVVRIGDTVRRPLGAHSPFVHRLLLHFERHGWRGAPRYLGVDGKGREVLAFLDGQAPARSTDGLAEVARLVREFHDLTAGTEFAGDQEVVCHNDLSPRNTVCRDGVPVAFLDWDLAAPGRRVHDLAHLCRRHLDLEDPKVAAEGLRTICDAYGLGERRAELEAALQPPPAG